MLQRVDQVMSGSKALPKRGLHGLKRSATNRFVTKRLDCDLIIAYNNLSSRFCGLYTNNFASQFAIQPEEVTRQWKNVLLQFKAATIEAALDYIEAGQTKFTKYPPAPLEFREICLVVRDMGYGVDEKPVAVSNQNDATLTPFEREVNKKRDAYDPLWREKVAAAPHGYQKMLIMSAADHGGENNIPDNLLGILKSVARSIERRKNWGCEKCSEPNNWCKACRGIGRRVAA